MDKFSINKKFKEIYNVKNNKCPICDEAFPNILISIVKFKDKAYHFKCYEELINLNIIKEGSSHED